MFSTSCPRLMGPTCSRRSSRRFLRTWTSRIGARGKASTARRERLSLRGGAAPRHRGGLLRLGLPEAKPAGRLARTRYVLEIGDLLASDRLADERQVGAGVALRALWVGQNQGRTRL